MFRYKSIHLWYQYKGSSLDAFPFRPSQYFHSFCEKTASIFLKMGVELRGKALIAIILVVSGVDFLLIGVSLLFI